MKFYPKLNRLYTHFKHSLPFVPIIPYYSKRYQIANPKKRITFAIDTSMQKRIKGIDGV